MAGRKDIPARVRHVAEAMLTDRQYVRPIDVLLELGWVAHSEEDRWRQGRIPHLVAAVQGDPAKVPIAMAEFRAWTTERGLVPSEAAYVARTRDRRPLTFTATGDADVELDYRTHWFSPALSERERERLVEKDGRPPELLVVWSVNPWTCETCEREFGKGELLLMEEQGPHCLECVDLGHLVYLPSGDAARTRRAKALSGLSAVVVRWSRARRRYERQGILAERDAVERATGERLS